jgi:hypothetical protein
LRERAAEDNESLGRGILGEDWWAKNGRLALAELDTPALDFSGAN